MTEVKKTSSLEEKLAAAAEAQWDEWGMSNRDWARLNGQYGAPKVETDDTGMTSITWKDKETIKTKKDIEEDVVDFRTSDGAVIKIPRALCVSNWPTVFRSAPGKNTSRFGR